MQCRELLEVGLARQSLHRRRLKSLKASPLKLKLRFQKGIEVETFPGWPDVFDVDEFVAYSLAQRNIYPGKMIMKSFRGFCHKDIHFL